MDAKFRTEISRPAMEYLARKGLGEAYVHKQQQLAYSYLAKRLKDRMPPEPIVTRYVASELSPRKKHMYAYVSPNKDVIVHVKHSLERANPYISKEILLSSIVAHEFSHRAEGLIWDNFQALALTQLELAGRVPQAARFFALFNRAKPNPLATASYEYYFLHVMLQARANYLELHFTHSHTQVRHELWQLEHHLCRANKTDYTGYMFMKYLQERLGLTATLALTERMRLRNEYEFMNPDVYYMRAAKSGILSEILANCKNP